MSKSWILLLFISFAASSSLLGQSDKTPRYDERNRNYDKGATYGTTSTKVKKKKSKFPSYNDQFDQKVEEYYARMEENSKQYKKIDRQMRRPQYSDPSYFGHKHKPKKRPPGKKKFCKECQIVH